MYKDFRKCLKGKLHIIIICLRSRKMRMLSKLPKNCSHKKQLMAKMNSKKVLKKGKRRRCGQIIKKDRI